MKFKIVITKELIEQSKRGEPDSCLVANAVNTVLDKEFRAFTGLCQTSFKENGIVNYAIRNPKAISDLINDFDYGRVNENPERFIGKEYEIDIPNEVIDHLYSDHVEVANKLANCKELKLAEV